MRPKFIVSISAKAELQAHMLTRRSPRGAAQIFCEKFYGDRKIKQETFLESCGLADLFTTCTGGRNRKCAEAFAKGDGDWEKIETDLLNGLKLQGTGTAKDVMTCIKKLGCEKDFPLFCAIHKIAFEGAKPESIVDLYK